MSLTATDARGRPPGSHGPGIALVGARGAGKSTVGLLVAERLGLPFLDADRLLEARFGRSVARIFTEEGEPAFRDAEERILAELAAGPPAVVATGGGVVLRASNRARLRAFGRVVWLETSPEALASRLALDPRGLADRPSLTGAGTLGEIADVLASRIPLYAEVADARVETDDRAPGAVAVAVLEALDRLAARTGVGGGSS